jgi:hypothetical protein
MEYISALNNTENLAHAKIWMDLEDTILKDIIHMEKKYWSYFTEWNQALYAHMNNKRKMKKKVQLQLTLGKEGMVSYCFMGIEL